jgi:hypothetical protein
MGHHICGCSSMVESQPSKLVVWVRFPSPAPYIGLSPSGKARDFDSRMRRFKSCQPCHLYDLILHAGVAELADALDLGSSAYGVGVQVPPPAPKILNMPK